jgi:antitoxin component YwqK of YwqJK toxin-antitoxin module
MEWLKHLAIHKHKDGVIVNAIYQGVHVSRDIPGNITAIYNFANGKRNGFQYLFYQHDVLKAKRHYINDKQHSIQLEYNTDGQLQRRENFLYGKLYGVQEKWDDYSGYRKYDASKYHVHSPYEILYYD